MGFNCYTNCHIPIKMIKRITTYGDELKLNVLQNEDRYLKSNFSTIRPSITGNVYRGLLLNGCEDNRWVKVNKPYALEMQKET